MIIVIDNYDSFTYNLVQYLGELGAETTVFRNDATTVDEIRRMRPDKILISPGPGQPRDAGISEAVISQLGGSTPLIGVCLGHQAIGEVFGGKIVRAKNIMHGKTSKIRHDRRGIFKGLPNPFDATRYHSLVVDKKSFPDVLKVTAESEDGEIMGLKHVSRPIYGVQFHPESILTSAGKKLLKNFLDL